MYIQSLPSEPRGGWPASTIKAFVCTPHIHLRLWINRIFFLSQKAYFTNS